MQNKSKELINSLYRIFGRLGITVTLVILISNVYPKVISEYIKNNPNDNGIIWPIIIILTMVGLFKLLFPTLFTIRYETT